MLSVIYYIIYIVFYIFIYFMRSACVFTASFSSLSLSSPSWSQPPSSSPSSSPSPSPWWSLSPSPSHVRPRVRVRAHGLVCFAGQTIPTMADPKQLSLLQLSVTVGIYLSARARVSAMYMCALVHGHAHVRVHVCLGAQRSCGEHILLPSVFRLSVFAMRHHSKMLIR